MNCRVHGLDLATVFWSTFLLTFLYGIDAKIMSRSVTTDELTRQALRRTTRQWRCKLTPQYQQQAAHHWMQHLLQLPEWIASHHVALYWPQQGEMNPLDLLSAAFSKTKRFYLPVLHPWKVGHLLFTPYDINTPTVLNRFGIPEPISPLRNRLPPWCLDLVITPLVCFDEQGTRLGMGGGYYDRTFAFIRRSLHKTKLIGAAYEAQKVAPLITNTWDIPLHSVITDQKIYRCRQNQKR